MATVRCANLWMVRGWIVPAVVGGVVAMLAGVAAGGVAGNEPDALAQVNASAGAPEPLVEHVHVHMRSGVLSATLRNGVVVHAREMRPAERAGVKIDESMGRVVLPGHVHVVVALNGGEIFETFETRGVTLMAAGAFERAEECEGDEGAAGAVGARVRSLVLPDAVLVHVEGTAVGVEEALRWLAGRLGDERGAGSVERAVDDAMLDEHRARLRAMFDDAKQQRRIAIQDAAIAALYRDAPNRDALDSRALSPQGHALRVTNEQVRMWAARLARASPIEVGVAGDMAADDAVRLVARTLGGLADRPAVEHDWQRTLRAIDNGRDRLIGCGRDLGEMHAREPVLVGFRGADLGDVRGQRLMRATAMVLTDACRSAMEKSGAKWTSPPEIAEIEFVAMPGLAYRGTGFVAAVLPSNGLPLAHADSASAMAFAVMDDLAERGPTLEALARAVRRLVEQADSFEGDPWLWSAVLARSRVRGVDPEALSGARAFYERLTPGDIARALREHAAGEGGRFSVRLFER